MEINVKNILASTKDIELTKEEGIKFNISKDFYFKYRWVNFLLWDSIPFLFKNKIKNFHKETEYFFKINNKKTLNFCYKMAVLLAKGDYEKNHLCHYTFCIDGKRHTYGIAEISLEIFYASKIIKNKMDLIINNEEQYENNIIRVNFNKREML